MKFTLFTLVLAATILVNHSSQASDCSELWGNGFPDVRPAHTPVGCDEFRPLASPVTVDQRYYTVSSLTHESAVKQQLEIIAEAVSYSAAKYSSYGRVPAITVVRQDMPHPNGSGAAAMAVTYVEFFDLNIENCPIFIYPLTEVLSKDELVQLVAHEVFHCVQKLNFKDQVTYAANNSSEQGWWFEGLAQVFSNFVYPINDFEYTARFPAPDQTVPFYDQPNAYSSENFWQSYANTLSDNALWSMMNQMTTNGAETPPVVINRLPRFSEALHNYAKQITLKKVRDSSGHLSPYDMPFENHVLANTPHQSVNLVHFDLTVGAFQVTLPKAGKWKLQFNHPENTKISMKKADEADYTPVSGMVEITTECDRERVMQIVITTAADQQTMNTTRLVVDKESNPDCDCRTHPEAPPQTDDCLTGTWDLDHSSVEQYWNRLNTNPRAEFTGSTGGFAVSFLPGNVGIWVGESWRLSSRAQLNPGMVMNYSRTTNGVSGFSFSAHDGFACSHQTSMNMTAVQIININGQGGSTSNVMPFSPGEGSFSYSCNATEFVLQVFTYQGNSQDIEYVFHRR